MIKTELNRVHGWRICATLPLFLALFACQKPAQPQAINKTQPGSPPKARVDKADTSHPGIYCSFMDHEGILWFGSNGRGVYRYDGTSFTHITETNGLSNNQVCAITEDRDGNLWFGTANGLCRYDRKTFTTVPIPQSDTTSLWLDKVYPIVNPNQVMSILQDRHGIFWIGTNGAGVLRYDPSQHLGERIFTRFWSEAGMVYEDGLQHNIVLRIIEDLSGNIWFTSLSHAGVSRYDGESFQQFMPEDGLSDDFVRTIYCDSKGILWIGTHGNRNGGLDRFDGKTFTNFHKTDNGLAHNNVLGICEDKSGNMWLASGADHLSLFDGKSFEYFKTQDNLKLDRILCIVEDRLGKIWFGGSNGLWVFDGNTTVSMTQGINGL